MWKVSDSLDSQYLILSGYKIFKRDGGEMELISEDKVVGLLNYHFSASIQTLWIFHPSLWGDFCTREVGWQIKKWVHIMSLIVISVRFADTIGPLRWSRTPTWLKLEWRQTQSCLNGFTIPETPAAPGKCKHLSLDKTLSHVFCLSSTYLTAAHTDTNSLSKCIWVTPNPVM